jgi:hypothetical protein
MALKRRKSRNGVTLSPDQLGQEGADLLANEVGDVTHDVRQVVNHWGEVWHHFEFSFGDPIPLVSDSDDGVFDAEQAFDTLKSVFANHYRGEALSLIEVILVADGKQFRTGWRSLTHTETLYSMFEQIPDKLHFVVGVKGTSKYEGTIGIAVWLEAPKWYGKREARKDYGRASKRHAQRAKHREAQARYKGKKAKGAKGGPKKKAMGTGSAAKSKGKTRRASGKRRART